MSPRLRGVLAVVFAGTLVVPVGYVWAGSDANARLQATTVKKTTARTTTKRTTTTSQKRRLTPYQRFLAEGRRIYRKHCGQCHALDAARAAGFGTPTTEPGPDFNYVKVTVQSSINALTDHIPGHESIIRKVPWKQVVHVAQYTALMTKKNKIRGTRHYG